VLIRAKCQRKRYITRPVIVRPRSYNGDGVAGDCPNSDTAVAKRKKRRWVAQSLVEESRSSTDGVVLQVSGIWYLVSGICARRGGEESAALPDT
jgi:hypothetical protein